MSKPDIHLVDEADEVEQQFRSVMRRLAGGVSVVTAGRDDDITGMTITSLTSLSASPPRVLISEVTVTGGVTRGSFGERFVVFA